MAVFGTIEEQLIELKQKLSTRQTQHDARVAEEAVYKKILKETFGASSIERAEELVAEMEKEIQKLETSLNKKIKKVAEALL